MTRRKKTVIVLACFVLLALYEIGGNVFTDGLYSFFVFFFCYIFMALDSMRRINILSLYRYCSLKNMYVTLMKKQIVPIFAYVFFFMIIGVASEILGLFLGRSIFVSFPARIKFFIFSYINLFILQYLLLVLRMLYGKWIALIAACCCIVGSFLQAFAGGLYLTPLILNTAYYRGKTLLTDRTAVSYLLCFMVLAFFTVLSVKKDKTVSK